MTFFFFFAHEPRLKISHDCKELVNQVIEQLMIIIENLIRRKDVSENYGH